MNQTVHTRVVLLDVQDFRFVVNKVRKAVNRSEVLRQKIFVGNRNAEFGFDKRDQIENSQRVDEPVFQQRLIVAYVLCHWKLLRQERFYFGGRVLLIHDHLKDISSTVTVALHQEPIGTSQIDRGAGYAYHGNRIPRSKAHFRTP